MQTNNLIAKRNTLAALVVLLSLISVAHGTGTTQLANSPLSGASSADIDPNIMFVMDDSLSMSWDYLPDWAGGKNNTDPLVTIPISLWQSKNSRFNGIAYNPAITYLPPTNYTSAGAVDTTTYPSQTASNTANWTAVKRNPYATSATDNLVGNAFYYTTIPGEYCASASMRSCNTQSSADATYPIPAYLRWCNSAASAVLASPAAAACQATEINNRGSTDVFGYPRMPAPRTSVVTITAGGSATGVVVGTKQIMSVATGSQPDATALATAIASSINACSFAITGACTVTGYRASVSGGALTIYAPDVSTSTPVVSASPSLSASVFARPAGNLAPGENLLTVITPSVTDYAKAVTRSDCAGATCTFNEEMTNYANWWAYYHTRMQTMKTSASLAFATLGDRYRVGFMSINNYTGTSSMGASFQNIDAFDSTNKLAWYQKLFSSTPSGDTPLRLALAQAGRIYAGTLKGTFNGTLIKDPVQYSCQQNVTILSTDGYWNDAGGLQISNSPGIDSSSPAKYTHAQTLVGDHDGPAITVPAVVKRPQLDAGAPTYTKTISQITETTTPTVATWLQQKVDKIQSQQASLQISTKTQWQSSTSSLQATTSTLQTQTSNLQSATSQLRERTRQLQQSTFTQPTISTKTQWQSRTYQILKSTSYSQAQAKKQVLQIKRSQLQQQTSRLQESTSSLLKSTSTLQSRTYQLQKNSVQAQKRTSSNSGATWSSWANVATCIPASGEAECRLLAASGWVDATSCSVVTAAANPAIVNPGTDSQYTLYTTTSQCQYTSATAWAGAASCTAQPKSTATPYTVGTATECQYTAWSTPASATTCTPANQSTGSGAWTVGTAVSCSYTTPTSYTNSTGTCETVPQSSGTGVWTVATAKSCQYSSWSTATTTGSCTNVAQTASSPFTQLTATQCTYAAWDSAWSNATAACTKLDQSTGSGAWSGPATQCQYSASSAWTDVGSCSVTAGGPTYGYSVLNPTVECQSVTGWTTPAPAPSCTNGTTTACTTTTPSAWGNVGSCTGSTSGTGVVTECQLTWTTPTAVASCTEDATTDCDTTWTGWTNVVSCPNNGTTSKCQYLDWTGYSDVVAPSSCTYRNASTGTGTWVGPVRQCSYGAWTTPANDSSCSKVNQSSGTTNGTVWAVNVAKRCSYSGWSSWSNATGTCTTATQSSSNPYTATAVNCQYVDGSPVTVGSCTKSTKTAASPYTALTATACGYGTYGAWTDVGSCSTVVESTSSPYNPTAVKCQSVWTPWSNAAYCETSPTTKCQYGTPSWVDTPAGCTPAASTSSPYTVGTATLACNVTPISGWSPVYVDASTTPLASCTGGPDGSGNTVSCQTVLKPPTSRYVGTCAESVDDGTPEHSTIGCSTNNFGTPVLDASCKSVETPASAGNSWKGIACAESYEGATPDTLADVAQYYYMTDLRDTSLGNCSGGDVTSGSVTTTNLVCDNNVTSSGESTASWQHMTTYTLGLGASGFMQYQSDYLTAGSGDYFSVKNGVLADTSTGVCSWQTRGACNWPKPKSNEQTNIDDLWHAAVNGRGTYYSATDPKSLAAGISGALASISIKDGSLAAVSITNPNMAAGENELFQVSFKAGEWSGEVIKRTINGTTSEISDTPAWSAQSVLDAKVSTSTHTARKIFTYNPGAESTTGADDDLKLFLWSNLSTTEKGYFSKASLSSLTQFCTTGTICLSSATQDDASGENIVNFLRGDKSHEGPIADLGTYYRQRTHVLGDIVGSEVVYVKNSPWGYADYKYGDFKAANSSRAAMLYVAANDGMLHAFDPSTGDESWAYVPRIIMPKLFSLADKNYASPLIHRFLVDGTPVMGDICASDCATPATGTSPTVWKTILVGGLNSGGRGYYALDITDPAKPKALWEFTNDNLGYSYGNPIITKLKDGTWVVIVTSGYNNISPGDGQGRLFILNANTGVLIRSISTGAGDTDTTATTGEHGPSGLSRISAWANYPQLNNTAQRVYGGDLFGNLWRFDINGDIPIAAVAPATPVYDAQRLATLKDPDGVAQPITSRPELSKVKNYPVVFVATGQLLGLNDLSTAQIQSVYAIKDRLTDSDFGNPRDLEVSPGTFVKQTMTSDTCAADNPYCTEGEAVVTSTKTTVDFSTKHGWFVDFPVAGERVNTDIRLIAGTLALTTNTPQSGYCVPVGVSYAYYLDYRTGGYVEGTLGVSGISYGSFLSSAPVIVRMPDGKYKQLTQGDGGSSGGGGGSGGSGAGSGIPLINDLPFEKDPFDTRRVSWRELVTE